jgi:hypothetical protein
MLVNASAECRLETFVYPTKAEPYITAFGFTPITEDDERCVMERTTCKEIDLGCQFSLHIFWDKGSKKDRRLYFLAADPIMAIVGQCRGKGGGQSKFFGGGTLSCLH